eukprot:5891376-Prymnesium_polylepis.1
MRDPRRRVARLAARAGAAWRSQSGRRASAAPVRGGGRTGRARALPAPPKERGVRPQAQAGSGAEARAA